MEMLGPSNQTFLGCIGVSEPVALRAPLKDAFRAPVKSSYRSRLSFMGSFQDGGFNAAGGLGFLRFRISGSGAVL